MTILHNKMIFLTAFLLLIMSGLFALPQLSDFLTDEERALLNGKGEITRFHFDDTTPELLPSVPQAELVRDKLKGMEANFSIEGIFFIQKSLTDESDVDAELLKIHNILTSVSRIQGLQYYSASREEMRLLFEECWRLDEEGEPAEDLSFSSLPSRTEFTIHQKDLTFGANQSEVEIVSSPESLLMSMKNLTRMKYNGWLKVINEGNFQTHMLIIPTEDGILYYGNMSAKAIKAGFIVERASNSFYNRMRAMFNWFSGIYE